MKDDIYEQNRWSTSPEDDDKNDDQWPSLRAAPVELAPPRILPPVCVKYISELMESLFAINATQASALGNPIEVANKTFKATQKGNSGDEDCLAKKSLHDWSMIAWW